MLTLQLKQINRMNRNIFNTIFGVLYFSLSTPCLAQEPLDSAYLAGIDSLLENYEREKQVDLLKVQHLATSLNEERKMDWEWARQSVRAGISVFTQKSFRDEPAYFEKRDFSKQDYAVAAAPLAVNWILKASGVKSRSSLKRMAIANSITLALHFGMVKGLKSVVHETRPNGEDNQSFPSGHSSLAFASAAILSREYGHISPWITVGSYGCATATQILRIRHNAHWMTDVCMGAGIGLFSANMGYFITDQFLGSEEIYTPELRRRDLLRMAKHNYMPSGARFITGQETGAKTVKRENLELFSDFEGDVKVKTSAAISVGMDASWYLTPYFSLEAMARMSSAQAKVFASPTEGDPSLFCGGNMSFYHFDMAASLSAPFGLKHRMGCRAIAGVRNTQTLNLDSYSYDADGNMVTTPFVRVPGQTKFELGAGITLDVLGTKNYAVGFAFDYYHAFTKIMPDRYSVSSTWKTFF